MTSPRTGLGAPLGQCSTRTRGRGLHFRGGHWQFLERLHLPPAAAYRGLGRAPESDLSSIALSAVRELHRLV